MGGGGETSEDGATGTHVDFRCRCSSDPSGSGSCSGSGSSYASSGTSSYVSVVEGVVPSSIDVGCVFAAMGLLVS